jgi:RNA polymerase sigma-70 factor (ECF subfamily)
VTNEVGWIRRARQGDHDAFSRLVHAYQTPVYNLAYRMLGNRSEAEEAAQEAFIRAYTHLGRYDPERPFRTWLLSITSHYCIDRLRRRRITWLPLEDELASNGQFALAGLSPNPASVVAQREWEEEIQRMLANLSPTDRAAITLCYWYDCSYEEIAETLDLTVSAVKSRLFRARRTMAKMIQEQQKEANSAM